MSSGEAELYAIVKASTEVLSVQSMLQELGLQVGATVATDSAAAKGAVMRTGSGRMEHISLNHLWVQEKASGGDILYIKVLREVNVGDLFTHHWSAADGAKHLSGLGARICKEGEYA